MASLGSISKYATKGVLTFMALGLAAAAATQVASGPALPVHPVSPTPPAAFLDRPIPDSTANAAQLRRGKSLLVAGDCVACHSRAGGTPLSGGLGLKTPFGQIYSSNISPDPDTGIGGWSSDEFYRAMHEGIGAHGENLYPAFPYPWFRRVARDDVDALFAYLMTTPQVRYTPPKNELPFPLSLRFVVMGWNLLFLHSDQFRPDETHTAEWNRGAYLVNGLGHCGACHTPKNLLGADRPGNDLNGGTIDDWVAPDLTGNVRTGLGRWSAQDVAEFLLSGRNAHAGAGGSMADAVTHSTSMMSDADRAAIATYLKSLAARADALVGLTDATTMHRGAAIYSDVCASCHLDNGEGQPRLFPPLKNNAMLQQADATGLEHLILAGSRIGTGPTRPSPLSMPSFAWKLTDLQVADVATFIRNSWGNQASAVSAPQVAKLRKKLDLQTPRLTANSGDRK